MAKNKIYFMDFIRKEWDGKNIHFKNDFNGFICRINDQRNMVFFTRKYGVNTISISITPFFIRYDTILVTIEVNGYEINRYENKTFKEFSIEDYIGFVYRKLAEIEILLRLKENVLTLFSPAGD